MRTWSKRLGIVCVLWMLHPLAAEAAYRCRVTVRTPGGQTLVDKEVEVNPWLPWQTPEGMARNQGLGADARNQPTGAVIDVTCWEIKKPKLWGIIPVVYTYPSDSLKGITFAYAVPIDMGAAAASLGQGAPDSNPGSGVASSIDVSIVGELGFAKADASSTVSFAGGARAAKPFNPTLDVFGQLMLGITHFTGESDFTLKPEGGVIYSPKGKPFGVTAYIGVPVIFFTGAHERGFEIGGGIVLPGRRRQ
ncbi:MAG: hypothetical protein U0Q11_14335 [Vicinamibacterales bacterium]